MKVKVKLNTPVYEVKHHVSASSDRLLKGIEKNKQEELRRAVEYWLENGCKGYKAIKSGLFPSINVPCKSTKTQL